MTLEAKLAWCAGLFEGEGTASKTRHGICIAIYQSSNDGIPEVLLRFQDYIGGYGKISGRQRKQGVRKSLPKREYSLSFRKAEQERVLTRLWEFLGPVKQAQIIKATGRAYNDNAFYTPSYSIMREV